MNWLSCLKVLLLGMVMGCHLACADFNMLIKPLTHQTQNDKQPLHQAQKIYRILASKQYSKLNVHIHPTQRVGFMMYAYTTSNQYVRRFSDTNKVFNQKDFNRYLVESKIRFTWGQKDGSGDYLVTSLSNYLDTWVHADTLKNPTIHIKYTQKLSNHFDDSAKAYWGTVDFS